MPTKSKSKLKLKLYGTKDLKKLFGPDFRIRSAEEYLSAPMVGVDEVLAELNRSTTEKKPSSRKDLIRDMTLQVQQMRKQLEILEQKLIQIK